MSQKNLPPNFKSFFENVVIDENGSLVVAALSEASASFAETATSASFAETATSASFAATASYMSGSILNYPDTDGETPTVNVIATMTSASYAALTPKDANTFYIIV